MIIIGHRGAKGLAPENTLTAFKKALDLDVDQIEFDVRVSKDGIPIIHHDATLSDDSGSKLRIDQHNLNELKEHEPNMPTLVETLKVINGAVPLYIEIKINVNIAPIVDELKKYHHEFAVGSKSQKTLRALHVAMPAIPKIVIEPFSGIRATWRARQVGAKTLSMNQLFLWFGFIRVMKNKGYTLYAYPLNNPIKAKRWAKHGLAGVVTDFPDRFVSKKER